MFSFASVRFKLLHFFFMNESAEINVKNCKTNKLICAAKIFEICGTKLIFFLSRYVCGFGFLITRIKKKNEGKLE